MKDLASRDCVPCRADTPPLKGPALESYRQAVSEWEVVGEKRLERTFRFPDFREALAFTGRVGALAEEQGHHPDIVLSWGRVGITLWTHTIDGLSESDFILAAKIDRL